MKYLGISVVLALSACGGGGSDPVVAGASPAEIQATIDAQNAIPNADSRSHGMPTIRNDNGPATQSTGRMHGMPTLVNSQSGVVQASSADRKHGMPTIYNVNGNQQ